MNLDLGPLVNHLLGTQKGPRSINVIYGNTTEYLGYRI